MNLIPNYLGHDAEYRKRRTQGCTGWDSEDGTLETIARIETFIADVQLPSQPTLIELGCGAGDLSLHFAGRGFRVRGFDIAPFAIEWAREKSAHRSLDAYFTVADLTQNLDPAPDRADVVLDGHCLHCIIGSDRKAFLQNARLCLKRGGLFHINTMCGTPPPPNDRDFDPTSRCVICNGVATRFFGTTESILQEILQADFQIERHVLQPSQYPGDADCLMVNAR